MTATAIEVIARAIIIRGADELLVAREIGRDWVFLPGGHVEIGEPTEVALVREIREELGIEAKVTGFVGAVEHTYVDRGQQHHEINLVFTVETIGPTESKEPHLEFDWIPIATVAEVDLRPEPVRAAVRKAAQGELSDSDGPYWSGAR